MNLKEFAEKDTEFKTACGKVNLPRSGFTIRCGTKTISVNHGALGLKRQASKWFQQKGLAYKEGKI